MGRSHPQAAAIVVSRYSYAGYSPLRVWAAAQATVCSVDGSEMDVMLGIELELDRKQLLSHFVVKKKKNFQ